MTAGVSAHVTGLYKVVAGEMVRDARRFTANLGAYSSAAKGSHVVETTGAITLNCGALTATGDVVIAVGASTVVIDGSGITIKSPEVTIDGPSNASKVVRG